MRTATILTFALALAAPAAAQVEETIERQVERLNAKEKSERLSAVAALCPVLAAEVSPAMVSAALRETDPLVRLHVNYALADRAARAERLAGSDKPAERAAARGFAVPLDLLIKACGDSQGTVRAHAAETLGWVRDPAALKPLIALASDTTPAVRAAAAEALGWMGDDRAAETVTGLLTDPSAEVVREAIYSAGQLRAAEAAPRVENLCKHADASVAAAAKQVAPVLKAELENKQAAEKALAQILPRLEFTEIPLGDVMEFVREVAALNVHVDWRALGEIKISGKTETTYKDAGVTVGNALSGLLLAADPKGRLGWSLHGGMVIVSTRDELARGGLNNLTRAVPGGDGKEEASAVAKALRQVLPKVEFGDIPLGDVVQFMRDVSAVNIAVDWKSLRELNIDQRTPVSTKLTQVSVADVLSMILASVGSHRLVYAIDGNTVFISTPPRVRFCTSPAVAKLRADALAVGKTDADAKVRKKLSVVLPKVQFTDIPLADVLQFTRDAAEISIDADWDAFKMGQTDQKTPITILLKQVSFSEYLWNLLRELDPAGRVGMKVSGGKVVISTWDKLNVP